MLRSLLLQMLVTLAPTRHAPAPPRGEPALFTEAAGNRADLTLDGEISRGRRALFAGMGQVAGGMSWGPAYIVFSAPVAPSLNGDVSMGLFVMF